MSDTTSWLIGRWEPAIRIGESIENKYWETFQRNSKGVYRLIAVRDDLNPEALNRVCGVDDTGTIYIGASDSSLLRRVSGLIQTHRSDYKSHPYRALSPRLAERFDQNKLAISWEITEEPWDREQELLVAYELAFGELPPMNNQRSVFEKA